LTSVTKPEDELDVVVALAPPVVDDDDDADDALDELALVPLPLTDWPTVPPMEATVAATGARSTVCANVRRAVVSATCACRTDARSCASVAGGVVAFVTLFAFVDASPSVADVTCCCAVVIACRSFARVDERADFAAWICEVRVAVELAIALRSLTIFAS